MARTPEQQAAIECRDLDILVEAGAGTGKTSTTVGRYERLLGEGDPDSVLVFTFTEKAATELRERVRAMRDESGREFSMSRVWIGTFHSVCSRILRAHPIAADIDPSFDVLDEVQADRLKQRAFDTALAATLAGTEDAETMLARFNRGTLADAIRDAYERLRAAGRSRPTLPEPPPSRSQSEILAELLRTAQVALDAPKLTRPTAEKVEGLIHLLQSRDPEELRYDELSEVCFSSSAKPIRDLIDGMPRACAELAAIEFGHATWEALGALLEAYGEAYAEAKAARGSLDFEDLQLKTLELLDRSEPIRARYREQFREIMVDEFQDTNQLQMNLIAALRGEDTTLFTVGDEMQAIYSFRFADVHLFRSRRSGGERPVTVLPLSANFRSQGEVIGAVNGIGNMFDQLIAGIRTDEEPGGAVGGTAHEFKPLRVGRDRDAGFTAEVELLLTEAESWREADLGPLSPPARNDEDGQPMGPKSAGEHEAEALALAHHIRRAVDEGVPPGEVVILFRTRSRMWLFEEALKQVGLRPYVVGGSRFWETREGVDLRALMAVVANPLDDEALTGCLAGPACGLSASSLWLLAQDRGHNDPIWPRVLAFAGADSPGEQAEADWLRARAFVRVVEALRHRMPGLPLAELVEEIVTGTGYDLVNLRRDPSGAGLANIRRVAEIAAEYEASEGRDLRGLIEWVDASAELDAEAAVATADEEADVVRLMTIHKSKGLEFGMVCVADLGSRKRAALESILWVSPEPATGEIEFGLRLPEPGGGNIDLYGWRDLQARAALDSTDEELRILHVALTRAERRLVLSGVVKLDDVKSPSESSSMALRLAQSYGLDRRGPDAIEVAAPAGLESLAEAPTPSTMRVLRNLAEDADRLRQGHEIRPVVPAASASTPPLARPTVTRHPEVPLSYSALAEFRDCPARFYARRVLKLEDPGADRSISAEEPLDPDLTPVRRPDGTEFGNAVHGLLERMAARRWVRPTEAEILRTLRAEGAKHDQESASNALEMIDAFTASELGRKVSRRSTATEVSLLLEIEGVMLRGSIDLLVSDLDPPLIVDYKSNRLAGTPAELMEEKRYDLQRDLYALAVSRAMKTDRVETAYVFLRAADRPVRDVFDRERLDAAADSIGRLVGDIVAGRYLGDPEASRQPCGRCWACETLVP